MVMAQGRQGGREPFPCRGHISGSVLKASDQLGGGSPDGRAGVGWPAQPLVSQMGVWVLAGHEDPLGPWWARVGGQGRAHGPQAQQRLFLFIRPVGLTLPGKGGAWHSVPAPVSPSCFYSSIPGQDSGKVVIWNMSPVLQEDDEKDENVPKMLCQMDNHLGITGWPFAGFACWHSAQG